MSAIGSDHEARACLRFAVITLLLLPVSVAGADEERVRLRLTPRLCAMENAQQSCFTVVSIRWQADVPLSACVHRHDLEGPLHCWHSVQAGELDITVDAAADIVFELRAGDRLLAAETLQVARENEIRRRRRNPWTFF